MSLATSSLLLASSKVSPILLFRLASNPTLAATATSARTTRSPTAPRALALTTVGTKRELERGTSRTEDTPTTGEDLVTSPSSEFCPSFFASWARIDNLLPTGSLMASTLPAPLPVSRFLLPLVQPDVLTSLPLHLSPSDVRRCDPLLSPHPIWGRNQGQGRRNCRNWRSRTLWCPLRQRARSQCHRHLALALERRGRKEDGSEELCRHR